MQDIYTLDKAEAEIGRHFSKNRNATITAIYRKLRSLPALEPYGDYILFAVIVSVMTNMGIRIRAGLLMRAMRQSPELKGKTVLLRELLKPQQNTPFFKVNAFQRRGK